MSIKIVTLSLILLSTLILAGCTPQLTPASLPTPAPTPTNSPSPSPLVSQDETDLIKTTIKQAIVAKHGATANNLTISVSKIVGDYSSGGASAIDSGGGMWFAAKVDGQWKLVWDGNGIINCTDLAPYPEIPSSLIPECFDQKAEKMVIR